MKIDIWSDTACPFCYIGKRNFEKALEQFPHRDKVKLILHSFELDPNAPKSQHMNLDQMLAKKYNLSLERAKQMNVAVTQRAAEAGVHFDLEAAILTNHFDGHRLLHLAKDRGVQPEMQEKLFAAYFSEGKDVSDHRVLIQLGSEAGLKPAEVKDMLESEMYVAEVREDEAIANELGISGVPAFVLAEKYLISGAQPVETFIEALNAAWSEREQ